MKPFKYLWSQAKTSLKVVIILFAIGTFLDILSTLTAIRRHGPEMEINIFVSWGLPIWALFLIKVLMVYVFSYTILYGFDKEYKTSAGKFKRYIHFIANYWTIYLLIYILLILFIVSFNNFQFAAKIPGSLKPIPEKEMAEIYTKDIIQGELVARETAKVVNHDQSLLLIFKVAMHTIALVLTLSWSQEKQWVVNG